MCSVWKALVAWCNGYGLAASQLQRLRDKNIPLTVTVDKVAASGGYMMACVADKIVSAPFAIVGSIGVVAQMPNFNRFLKSKILISNCTLPGSISVL
ncbi:protease [Escherichia coli]|uniref:Protease n=1 Tax=Escherichia coli TaxID=562 RepID=A0A377D345_ECOLX|nr:protease [Escherichia coli]